MAEEGLAVSGGPLTLPDGRSALGGEVISRHILGRGRMKDQRTHLFLLSDPVAQIKVPAEEEARRWVVGLEKVITSTKGLDRQVKTEQYPLGGDEG